MKNKKILFFSALIFLSTIFALISEKVMAQSCGDGGTCKETSGVVTCDSGYEGIDFTSGACGTLGDGKAYICCKAKATATDTTGTPANIKFESPLNVTTVEALLAKVLGTFQGMIVVLCLVFFVWAAIVYITSAGDETRVKSAKSGMTAALIGLALGIAAPSILKTIATILEWKEESSELTNALTFSQIALNVLNFLLGVVGVLGLIMLVVGGVMYFGAAANEENVKAAKGTIKYAIMGIALALGAMVIVRQIAALLTAS